jgi:hypothetical protein
MTQVRYCSHHPRMKAGWSCSACKTDLCPDCVATETLGHRHAPVDVCCRCRRGVVAISTHRAQALPFAQRLLDAPGFPLGATGIISLVVLGGIRALTSYVGMSSMLMMGAGVFLLRQGLFWAAVFFIIRSSAEGARKMGVLGLRDIQSDVVTPALKGLLSTALLWLPAAIYVVAVSDDGVAGILTYEGYKDPVVWGLGIVGAVYAPMALLAGATDLGFAYVLNPIRIFAFIKRMGRDYLVAVFAVAVVLVFGRLVDHLLGLVLAHVNVPFVPRWVGASVSLYAPFVAARVLGILLFVHGEALDWGSSSDYQVPVLPGVRPRGVLPEKAAVRESRRDVPNAMPGREPARNESESVPFFDPQVGAPEDADGPSLQLAREPVAVSPAPAAAPPVVRESIAPLLRAVAADDLQEALRIYREMSGEDGAIPPLVHMQIGKAAAKARDWEVAAHAFKHVASGRSEHAGAGLISLAQVIGDGQRNHAWAKKLYQQAIERYPQTEVAAFAQTRLTAMGE